MISVKYIKLNPDTGIDINVVSDIKHDKKLECSVLHSLQPYLIESSGIVTTAETPLAITALNPCTPTITLESRPKLELPQPPQNTKPTKPRQREHKSQSKPRSLCKTPLAHQHPEFSLMPQNHSCNTINKKLKQLVTKSNDKVFCH